MTKYSNKLKKPCFWPISDPFSQFWGQKIFFPENPALPSTNSYGFLATCQNLEKSNDTIPRKHLDRREDGKMEGQRTLFHRTLLATTWGSIISEIKLKAICWQSLVPIDLRVNQILTYS